MNGSPQVSNPPPESATKKAVDWALKHWARVRLGHEGMVLDSIQRQTRIVEITARNAATGKTDCIDGWPEYEGETMGVDIGDEIHNHYYPAPPTPETPPSTESPTKKPASTLTKAAMVAALLAGGGGIGAAATVGIPWLLGMFDKPAAQQPVEQPDPNAYGLSL